MLVSILEILCGLLLLSTTIRRGSAPGKVVAALQPVEGIIGIIAIVVGILNVFGVSGIVLILAGLVLAAGAIGSIPTIGDDLRRAGNALGQFRLVIGLIALVLGVISLIRMIF